MREKPKGKLDLSGYISLDSVVKNYRVWNHVSDRLEADEMPPEDAPRRPTAHERRAVLNWIVAVREDQARANAGDPGRVAGRRLSNAEFDYTIRDLTGVDIRPTREFPVDPANEAGFDNSGESLTMSPALLKKYLAAARLVADHLVFTPDGLGFAPHPVVTDVDRDKYCVQRIPWFLPNARGSPRRLLPRRVAVRAPREPRKTEPERRRCGTRNRPERTLSDHGSCNLGGGVAAAQPTRRNSGLWRKLPAEIGKLAEARRGCDEMADLVVRLRKNYEPKVESLRVKGISPGSQPLVLARNRALAAMHMRYPGTKPTHDLEVFCRVFPDAFVVSDRGPYFDPRAAGKGRPLTAGFHLMQGYFRDDGPLYELVLDEAQHPPARCALVGAQFHHRGTYPPVQRFHLLRACRAAAIHAALGIRFRTIRRPRCDLGDQNQALREAYLTRAERWKSATRPSRRSRLTSTRWRALIRKVEHARLSAEPAQLRALTSFAARAYRRPLAHDEQTELIAFYKQLRQKDGLGHDDAIRDTVASVLMSPHFCYLSSRPRRASRRNPSRIMPWPAGSAISYGRACPTTSSSSTRPPATCGSPRC